MTKKKKNSKSTPYALNRKERGVVLKSMGFANYKEYLNSPLWEEIRSKKIRGKAKCANCESQENLQVHHNVYTEATLKGVSQYGLVVLCEDCHHNEHFTPKGRRRARWGRWSKGGKKKQPFKKHKTTARKGRRTISRKF